MTDEIKHRDGDAIASTERTLEGPADRQVSALPTIIVDPLLASSAAPAQAAEPAPQTAHENGSAGEEQPMQHVDSPPSDSDAAQGAHAAADLSAEAAERFAASIRPSWEPPPGGATELPAPSAPIAVTDAHGGAAQDEDLGKLPRSERKRGLLITAGAVAGFAALAILGVVTSGASIPSAAEAVASARQARPSAATGPENSAPALPAAPPAPQEDEASEASGRTAAEPTAQTEAEPPSQTAAAAEPAAPTEAEQSGAAAERAGVAAQAPAPQPVAGASVAPAAKPQPEASALAARTVRLRIAAVPAHAQLTLDGTPIPNPFEADVITGGKHRVQAHAAGHESRDVTIAFDRDRELTLHLEPSAPAKPAAKAARPRSARAARPARELRSAKSAPLPKPAPTRAPSRSRGAGFVSESPY